MNGPYSEKDNLNFLNVLPFCKATYFTFQPHISQKYIQLDIKFLFHSRSDEQHVLQVFFLQISITYSMFLGFIKNIHITYHRFILLII